MVAAHDRCDRHRRRRTPRVTPTTPSASSEIVKAHLYLDDDNETKERLT